MTVSVTWSLRPGKPPSQQLALLLQGVLKLGVPDTMPLHVVERRSYFTQALIDLCSFG